MQKLEKEHEEKQAERPRAATVGHGGPRWGRGWGPRSFAKLVLK